MPRVLPHLTSFAQPRNSAPSKYTMQTLPFHTLSFPIKRYNAHCHGTHDFLSTLIKLRDILAPALELRLRVPPSPGRWTTIIPLNPWRRTLTVFPLYRFPLSINASFGRWATRIPPATRRRTITNVPRSSFSFGWRWTARRASTPGRRTTRIASTTRWWRWRARRGRRVLSTTAWRWRTGYRARWATSATCWFALWWWGARSGYRG